MIKCSRVDGVTTIRVEGRVTAVAADLCEIIAAVYRSLHPRAQDLFKGAIILAVAHGDSPMWNLETVNAHVLESMCIDLTEAKRQAEKGDDMCDG